MSVSGSFQEIIAKQREALRELEQEVQRINKADLTVENGALKKEAEILQISWSAPMFSSKNRVRN